MKHLTDQLINGGKILLESLDSSGLDVDGALWFYFPEEGFWKLLISIPAIEREGPRAAYKEIQKALSKIDEKDRLSLDDVTVAKPHAPLLKLLRRSVDTHKSSGQLIPDMYIYRLV